MRRREYYWSLYHSTEKNQIDNLRTDQVEAIFAALPKTMHEAWFIWRDGFERWKPFEDFPQLLLSLRKSDDRPVEMPPPPPAKIMSEDSVVSFGNPDDAPLGSSQVTKPEHDDEDDFDRGSISVSFSAKKVLPQAGTVVIPADAIPRSGSGLKTGAKTGAVPKPGDPPKTAAVPKATTGEVAKEDDLSNTLMESLESDLTLMQTGIGEDRNNFRFDKAFEVRIVANDKTFKNETVNISLKGIQLKEPLPSGLPRYFNIEIGKGKRVIPVVCSEIKRSDGKPSHRVRIEVNDYAPGLLAMLLSG